MSLASICKAFFVTLFANMTDYYFNGNPVLDYIFSEMGEEFNKFWNKELK